MTSSCSLFFRLDARREAVLQDLAEIERAMARLQEERVHVKRRLNMSTHIAALPEEILEKVFFHCVCSHERRCGFMPFLCLDCANTPKPCELVITHVCHSWRTIAVHYPRLWAVTSVSIWRYRGQRLDAYTMNIQLPRAGLGPVVVEADLSGLDTDSARACLQACVHKRLHLIGELAVTYWDNSIYNDLLCEPATPLILQRLELWAMGKVAWRKKELPLPIIENRPCPLLEVLSLGGMNIQCINPSRFPSLQELTLHLPPPTNLQLDTVIALLEGLPTLRKVRLSQAADVRLNIRARPSRAIELPVLRSISLVNFLVLFINFLVFPPSADLSFCCYHNDLNPRRDRHIYHFMAQVLASHVARDPYPLAAPFRIQRLVIHENTGGFGLSGLGDNDSFVDILGYEDVTQGDSPYQDVRFQIAEIPRVDGVVDIVLKLCKSMSLANVRVLHVSAIGMFQRRHWKIIAGIMPALETVSVEGEHAGRNLLNVLAAGMATGQQPPFPALKRVKFILKQELCRAYDSRPWLYPEETDAWMCRLHTALGRRRDLGLMLEELDIDFDSCANSLRQHILSGAYSAESFARIKPVVGRLILHLPCSEDVAEHRPSTSDPYMERRKTGLWFVN